MVPFLGTLLLGGGGSEEVSAIFDQEFTARIKQSSPRIVYIPIAWSSDQSTYPSCLNWFNGVLRRNDLEHAEVSMLIDLDSAHAEKVLDYDAMYIGGGNTYHLLDAVVRSRFDETIKSFLAAGKLVYGGSAGAIIMGSSIRTVLEENELGDGAVDRGLSLVGKAAIRCHYTPADMPHIAKYFRSGPPTPLIAVPESSGLVVTSQGLKVAGIDDVVLFYTAENSQNLKVGEYVVF